MDSVLPEKLPPCPECKEQGIEDSKVYSHGCWLTAMYCADGTDNCNYGRCNYSCSNGHYWVVEV